MFRLGVVQEEGGEETEYTFEFHQKGGGLEPVVTSISIQYSDGQIVIGANEAVERRIELDSYDEERNQFNISVDSSYFDRVPVSFLLDRLRRMEVQSDGDGKLQLFLEKKNRGFNGRHFVRRAMDGISSFSSSPVRSQPKRTYDPTREYEDPEGSDVPMRLMRIQATKKKQWEALKQRLVDFGKSSGLFQSIDVKRLGRSMGAPFQLQVKVRGPSSNITDVGYGVSQALPILVKILDSPEPRRPSFGRRKEAFLLLQQPEVHLHPKAQAEFSSLLGQTASKGRQSYIVETHSDYMIDRARIEIRRGNINKDDVSLIYLEPKKNIVKVHNIEFDEEGNMNGVPPHFRDFFLLESDRLMGFED